MKYILLVLLCSCSSVNLLAQSSRIQLTEKSIVRDSAGTIYPYSIWKMLMMQGDYVIQPLDRQNEQTEFLLKRLTEQQKIDRAEKMPKPRESDYFRTGKEFVPFKTTDIRNRKINLKDEKGKIIVINFWFINCPPCRMEIPALNEMVAAFKGNDKVRFIAVALDERPDLLQFLKTIPFDYDIVDQGRYLADRCGIRSYPTHVIIDQQGKVYFHTSGLAMNTVHWLKKSINELLAQTPVAQQ